MKNHEQSKFAVCVRQLKMTDQKELLKLLQTSPAAQEAGLRLMADESTQQWAVQNWLQQDDFYGIWVRSKLIGVIACFPYLDGSELGYFLHKNFQGQHIMTTALKQFLSMTSYCCLYAEVAVTNLPSQHVLLNNNFKLISHNQEQLTYRWLR